MKAAIRPLLTALSVAGLALALAAGCDDGKTNTGTDVPAGTDTPGGDGTVANTDGTGGTDTTGTPDGDVGTPDATTDTAGGTDTTTNPDTPVLFCGDGVCNNGESSLTCGSDCGAPTTNLLCPQVTQCLVQQCTVNVTQACFSSATAAGGACAAATGELGPWLDNNNCVAGCTQPATAGGTPPPPADAYGCVVSNCVGLTAKCYSVGDVGEGTCAAIGGCLNSCGTPNLSADYGTCARACVAAAKQKSAAAFFASQLCLAIMCPNATTTADKCVQDVTNAATSPPGLCVAALDACQNDGAVVVADPSPDAGGDSSAPDAAGDASSPDSAVVPDTANVDGASDADADATDTGDDTGPLPDTEGDLSSVSDIPVTPDVVPGDANGSGFFPFSAQRFIPRRF